MPNRIIKESIHTSEDVNRMTDFQFRLWVSLITYVDDFGRGDARPAIIKGSCFPLRDRITNKDIEAALRALAGIGCVSLYEVDGKPYLYFPTWESHQTVRNQKSKYPAPAEGQQLQAIESECPRNSIRIRIRIRKRIQIQKRTRGRVRRVLGGIPAESGQGGGTQGFCETACGCFPSARACCRGAEAQRTVAQERRGVHPESGHMAESRALGRQVA